MTQAELAARAGVHRSYISDLETGRRLSPSWDIVVALVQAIDLTAGEFLHLLEGERPTVMAPDLDALCREMNRLTPAQRQRVAQILRLLIECVTGRP